VRFVYSESAYDYGKEIRHKTRRTAKVHTRYLRRKSCAILGGVHLMFREERTAHNRGAGKRANPRRWTVRGVSRTEQTTKAWKAMKWWWSKRSSIVSSMSSAWLTELLKISTFFYPSSVDFSPALYPLRKQLFWSPRFNTCPFCILKS